MNIYFIVYFIVYCSINMDNNSMDNNSMNSTNEEDIDLLKLYEESLSEKEKLALKIARKMLANIFILEKTNGYINWLKNR